MNFMDLLQQGLGIGANYAAGAQGINQARAIGQQGYDLATALGEKVANRGQFQPFTVTTGTGGINTTPQGGVSTQLAPELQAAQDQMRSMGMGLFEQASRPIEDRQQSLYNQFSAMRAPEREQERLEMEQRMFNQGRTGVRTSLYGGTPEQLAMEKAFGQQQAQDALMARQQAFNEQGQAATIGSGLFGESFKPQAMLMDTLTSSIPVAQLADLGRRQGSQYEALLGQSGIEALLQGQTVASNLQQQQLQGLLNMIMGQQADPQQMLIAQALGIDPSQLSSGGFLGGLFDFFGGGGGSNTQSQPTGNINDIIPGWS